jgi:hypothetical protein
MIGSCWITCESASAITRFTTTSSPSAVLNRRAEVGCGVVLRMGRAVINVLKPEEMRRFRVWDRWGAEPETAGNADLGVGFPGFGIRSI